MRTNYNEYSVDDSRKNSEFSDFHVGLDEFGKTSERNPKESSESIGAAMISNQKKNLMDTESEEQRRNGQLTWMQALFRGIQVFLAETIACLFVYSIRLLTKVNGLSILSQALAESMTLMFVTAVFMRENAGHLDLLWTPMLWFLGKLGLPGWYVPVYWLAQTVASVLATLFAWSMTAGFDRSLGLGTPELHPGYTAGQGCGSEFLGTFIESSVFIWLLMAFGVKNYYEQVGTSYKSVLLYVLAMGFAHFAASVTFHPISGASFSWLMYFIPAAISGKLSSDWWIYLVGPLFGNVMALTVFKIYVWIDDNAGEHAYKRDIKNKVKTC